MTNPAYRKAAFALMMQEQAPTLSMPEGTDLNAYATLLIERFSNPSLRHRTWQIAMDGSQKLPQRLLEFSNVDDIYFDGYLFDSWPLDKVDA